MKTKYVCRGLISLYVIFHNNRTMWSTNLHVKFCRRGGGGKSRGKQSKNRRWRREDYWALFQSPFSKYVLRFLYLLLRLNA